MKRRKLKTAFVFAAALLVEALAFATAVAWHFRPVLPTRSFYATAHANGMIRMKLCRMPWRKDVAFMQITGNRGTLYPSGAPAAEPAVRCSTDSDGGVRVQTNGAPWTATVKLPESSDGGALDEPAERWFAVFIKEDKKTRAWRTDVRAMPDGFIRKYPYPHCDPRMEGLGGSIFHGGAEPGWTLWGCSPKISFENRRIGMEIHVKTVAFPVSLPF